MATQPTIPTTIGRFRIDAVLGRGGMGEVYKAYDPTLKRTVAVKTVRPDINNPEYLQRLYREAQSCARLQHANIVTIFEAGEADGAVFVAMEYLTGDTLSALLKAGNLRFEETIRILVQLLDALDHAHREGVIHRDIKPSNVVRQPDGKVKLLDFGLARMATENPLTQSGTVMGTPDYMSPEQLRGEELDNRTDIFSLGVMAYEMVTGHRPFASKSGDQASLLYRIVHEPPTPMTGYWPRVFPELETLILHALTKPRDERFKTAGEMRDALQEFLLRSGDRIALAQAEADCRRQHGEDLTADITVPSTTYTSTTSGTAASTEATGVAGGAAAPALAGQPPSAATTVLPMASRSKRVWVIGGAAVAAAAIALIVFLPGSSETSDGLRGGAPSGPAAGDSSSSGSGSGGGSVIVPPGTTQVAQTITQQARADAAPAAAVAQPTVEQKLAPPSNAASQPMSGPAAASSFATVSPAVNLGAKTLFTNSVGSAPSSSRAGLRYRILRRAADGAEEEVDASTTTFRSGERVRLSFDSNIDGHLYVIQKGTSGNWTVLFPDPDINGGRNDVRFGAQYQVPNEAWFKFDDNAGVEELFVFLSKEPVRQLPGFDRPVQRPETVMASVVTNYHQIQSRDLVLEREPARQSSNGTKVQATYVVNKSELGQAVAVQISLKHGK